MNIKEKCCEKLKIALCIGILLIVAYWYGGVRAYNNVGEYCALNNNLGTDGIVCIIPYQSLID